ncbi:unnamed protein product, partial [Ectocarpus sp. 12 AP-2014]
LESGRHRTYCRNEKPLRGQPWKIGDRRCVRFWMATTLFSGGNRYYTGGVPVPPTRARHCHDGENMILLLLANEVDCVPPHNQPLLSTIRSSSCLRTPNSSRSTHRKDSRGL